MPFGDEISEDIARQIAEEIDSEIMIRLLMGFGWTAVDFDFEDKRQVVQVSNWLQENCQGQYRRLNQCFVFEEDSDSVLFLLRWR